MLVQIDFIAFSFCVYNLDYLALGRPFCATVWCRYKYYISLLIFVDIKMIWINKNRTHNCWDLSAFIKTNYFFYRIFMCSNCLLYYNCVVFKSSELKHYYIKLLCLDTKGLWFYYKAVVFVLNNVLGISCIISSRKKILI